jgi:phage major head subunit gpT-like protein
MTDEMGVAEAESADRLVIRALVDAYARGAYRRDADRQKAVFTDDTRFVVYMDGEGTDPSQELNGRERPSHGESYCLAHHLYAEGGERKLMVASFR